MYVLRRIIMIKAKKQPVIKAGTTISYNPETFEKPDHYIETDDPMVILSNIKPFELCGRKFITFDTETHPVDLKNNDIPSNIVRRWVGRGKTAKPQDFPFCISICDGVNAYTIYDNIDNNFDKFKALAPLITDHTIDKIAHNSKYDLTMLKNAGLKLSGKIHDTVILSKLVDENRKAYSLKKLAESYEGGDVKYEYMVDAYKKANKVVDYRHIPKPLLSAYANADVWNCYILFKNEYPLLEDMQDLYETELEVMIALWEMEWHGMRLDMAYEKPLKDSLQQSADEMEKKIYTLAGRMFNINSTKQLYEVLIDIGTSASLISFTEKGNPSLDKDALAKLADKGIEMASCILEFRKATKLLNTYAVGIYDQHDANYRVHGSINQTEATTGRMSITKPAHRAS
jgi:DNA polymerase-1